MWTTETALYVGPASATKVEERRILVKMPDGEKAWARMAMTLPYRPVEGDDLLVVHHEGDAYVIGVIEGRGETTLRAPGTLILEAPHVHIKAGKFEVTTNRIVEKARDVYRWISGIFQVKAGRMRTSVEEDYHLRAGTTTLKARGDVNVDGQSINLG